MNGFTAFLRKEWMEQWRTLRLPILLVVFAIFGMTNPLIAKLTPEILEGLTGDGMMITLPEPVAMDAWAQFFKNASQTGLFVLLILFSGTLTGEMRRGTLTIPLSKGVARPVVVWSKFAITAFAWTLALTLSFCLTALYTRFLFPEALPRLTATATLLLWLFGLLLLATLLLSSVLTGTTAGTLLITAGFAVVLLIANILPDLHGWNPASLVQESLPMLQGMTEVSEIRPAIRITCFLTISFLLLAASLLRRFTPS